MNRDKQIEEMAKQLYGNFGLTMPTARNVAIYLTKKKGYRKSQDVAEEIFAEVEKYLVTGSTFYGQAIHSIGIGTFAELKKKYTETEND